MSNQTLVISYYTQNTPYESEAERLRASCAKFAIEARIEPLSSLGSWEKNCAQKASFIATKLKDLNRPLLWVDADAAFLQPPNFSLFSHCDFSARINEFLPKTHESRVCSGTLFVRPCERGIALVKDWVEECQRALNEAGRCMEVWDQIALRKALDRHPDLSFMPMPLEYVKIFDSDDLFVREEEVVIEHYQASRRLKSRIHDNCCNR
ncbi:MAG TPA: putative nucleotide-diphospho-sugar transferase [Rhabdochlamydiaceae bacterium]|jgi:hypothetical protein